MSDREAYSTAMQEAASAAWDHNWKSAVQAYQQALDSAPDDPQALAGLALGLFELRQDEQAIQAYGRLTRLVPGDPLPREKLAELYRRQGDELQAARQYMAAGEIHLARKDQARAIMAWEQAVRLDINQAQTHMRLALAYEDDTRNRPLAVVEYLHVARLLQQQGQDRRAEQALKRALALDPINPEVRNALADLRHRRPVKAPDAYPDELPSQVAQEEEAPAAMPTEEDELLQAAEAEVHYNPVEEAVRYAMGLLADSIWTGEVPPEAQAPLLAALDAHQLGDVDNAVQNYIRTRSAGLDDPALAFNLGVLAHYQQQYANAAMFLDDVVEHDAYRLASHLLLGQSHAIEGDREEAARHLLLALRTADREINPGTVDEASYEQLLTSLSADTEDRLAEVARAVILYLGDDRWRAKLGKALSNYAEQGKISYVPDLLELMTEGGRPELAAIMERVDGYMQRNLIRMATEELHYAIERAPDYLPAHRRLAATLLEEGRTQEAARTLNLLANVYLLRGSQDRAIELFQEVIDLWPADSEARRHVMDVLRQQGDSAGVLHHYEELANAHRLMADPDKAVAIYQEALDYSREVAAAPQDVVPILRGLADIEGQRLNWRRALQYYERINQMLPGDTGAARTVVDLYYQLGEPRKAVQALDDYIRHCIKRGDVRQVARVLAEQVQRHPQEIPLRQRLAEVYRQQGREQEAITQLDALGELLLDAGRTGEAAAAIQMIIEMNPPDVDGYRELLTQLKNGGQSL